MKNPPEVVISGMAGMFPESWNVTEFQKNLFDAVNLVTDDECKWPKGKPKNRLAVCLFLSEYMIQFTNLNNEYTKDCYAY